MRGLPRQLLILEILICFLPATLMLLLGLTMLPMQVAFLAQDSLYWEGSVLVLVAVACGLVGLASLFSVVSALFAGRERIERPVPVLGGVVIGAAPLVPQFVLGLVGGETLWGWWFALVVMPLIATAHILTLSRDLFIEGFKSGKRPLAGPRSWGAVALIAGLAVFAVVIRQGSSYAELEDRRAYWMQHRPPAYSYDWSASGWLKPMNRSLPRRVRVVGSELTGASYTFSRAPGEIHQYPAPSEGAWTIDDIFDALLDAKKRGSRINARFDDSTGAVLRARIESEASDADWGIEIQRFQPIDMKEAREPMPMFISRRK